jgi:hypothetical protein
MSMKGRQACTLETEKHGCGCAHAPPLPRTILPLGLGPLPHDRLWPPRLPLHSLSFSPSSRASRRRDLYASAWDIKMMRGRGCTWCARPLPACALALIGECCVYG